MYIVQKKKKKIEQIKPWFQIAVGALIGLLRSNSDFILMS